MATEIKHYKDSCKGFEEILYNSVSNKLASFKGFTESLKKNEKSVIENFPLLIFIVDSLQADCVITISKITEGERGQKTVQKFLNFVSANLKKLNKEFPKLDKETIIKQEELIKSIEPQILRIRTQRDKYFAHSDNKYFLKPRQLQIDFPKTYDDLTDILSTLQNIISTHSMIISGSGRIDMSGFVYANTFRTIEMLEKANKLSNNELE